MNIQNAIKSGKKFVRNSDRGPEKREIQYFKPGTGPHKDLFSFDYFVVDGEFATSLDLYAEEILTDDWKIEETPIKITKRKIEIALDNYKTGLYSKLEIYKLLGFKG